jgi:hypothetical protein
MNLQYGIFVDAQNGFIKKANGYSDHNILLKELFQDAKRQNKRLIVTAIDFSNAFGTVLHDLIMSTLKQFNFSVWIRAIMKDIYDNGQSTVEDRGRQGDSIKWRKGVKQGYP